MSPAPSIRSDQDGVKKPAAKRKPHRKSRTGCKQCRASRVKCDETKPSCSYCIRHSVECSYLSNDPSQLPAISGLHLNAQNVTPPNPGLSRQESIAASLSPERRSPGPCTSLHMKDLELLLHYSSATAPTVSSQDPGNSPVWAVIVPQIALRHPFLMHGIFASAALHLSHLNQHDVGLQREYSLLAAKHENIALPLFRSEAENITERNCDAVFAFAALLVVYSMASPDHSTVMFEPGSTAGDGLPEWIHLLRGVDAISRKRWNLLDDSPLKALVDPSRLRHRVLCPTDEIFLDALNNLFAIPSTGCEPERAADLEAYQQSLAFLRDSYTTPTSPRFPSQPVPYIWFTLVPERYLQLLRQKRPEALILLAYECVIVKRLEPLWFLDGVADRMMKTIMESLGEGWRAWVEWPLMEMGLNHAF